MKPPQRTFSRTVKPNVVSALLGSQLFQNRLAGDIQNADWKKRVFPAIRPGRFDFYYRGGRLFELAGQDFSTHIKYASVAGAKNDYVTEADLLGGNVTFLQNFDKDYERIKENCALYSGIEAQGVADVCALSSFACCGDDVVVLDIEVSLGGVGNVPGTRGSQQNRIDLLLFNTATRQLRFYEAKHYSNAELWAAHKATPRVADQMKRYQKILSSVQKQNEIVAAYSNYVNTMNQVFRGPGFKPLPPPTSVDPTAVLFVFGYDRGQEDRLKKLLINHPRLKGCRLLRKGNTKGLSAFALWKNVRTIP
jgi:hypothetical protein